MTTGHRDMPGFSSNGSRLLLQNQGSGTFWLLKYPIVNKSTVRLCHGPIKVTLRIAAWLETGAREKPIPVRGEFRSGSSGGCSDASVILHT